MAAAGPPVGDALARKLSTGRRREPSAVSRGRVPRPRGDVSETRAPRFLGEPSSSKRGGASSSRARVGGVTTATSAGRLDPSGLEGAGAGERQTNLRARDARRPRYQRDRGAGVT